MNKNLPEPLTEQDKNMSDHDLLIRLSERSDWVVKIMGNHLKHHTLFATVMLGALLTALGTLFVMVVF